MGRSKHRYWCTYYSHAIREVPLSFFFWNIFCGHCRWTILRSSTHTFDKTMRDAITVQRLSSLHLPSSCHLVSVLAVDLSDPQRGKGPADRMSATCKNHIRRLRLKAMWLNWWYVRGRLCSDTFRVYKKARRGFEISWGIKVVRKDAIIFHSRPLFC